MVRIASFAAPSPQARPARFGMTPATAPRHTPSSGGDVFFAGLLSRKSGPISQFNRHFVSSMPAPYQNAQTWREALFHLAKGLELLAPGGEENALAANQYFYQTIKPFLESVGVKVDLQHGKRSNGYYNPKERELALIAGPDRDSVTGAFCWYEEYMHFLQSEYFNGPIPLPPYRDPDDIELPQACLDAARKDVEGAFNFIERFMYKDQIQAAVEPLARKKAALELNIRDIYYAAGIDPVAHIPKWNERHPERLVND